MAEKLTLPKLSPADITALMAEGRAKGLYDDPIKDFVKAKDEYVVITDNVLFEGKKPTSVLSSVTQVVKRLAVDAQSNKTEWPRLKAYKRNIAGTTHVILVNLDVHESMVNGK